MGQLHRFHRLLPLALGLGGRHRRPCQWGEPERCSWRHMSPQKVEPGQGEERRLAGLVSDRTATAPEGGAGTGADRNQAGSKPFLTALEPRRLACPRRQWRVRPSQAWAQEE